MYPAPQHISYCKHNCVLTLIPVLQRDPLWSLECFLSSQKKRVAAVWMSSPMWQAGIPGRWVGLASTETNAMCGWGAAGSAKVSALQRSHSSAEQANCHLDCSVWNIAFCEDYRGFHRHVTPPALWNQYCDFLFFVKHGKDLDKSGWNCFFRSHKD